MKPPYTLDTVGPGLYSIELTTFSNRTLNFLVKDVFSLNDFKYQRQGPNEHQWYHYNRGEPPTSVKWQRAINEILYMQDRIF